MIIFPKQVSMTDSEWRNAVALLKVLPVDTRLRARSNQGIQGVSRKDYASSAADYLERNAKWDGRGYTYSSYFFYSIYFSVSATIIGFIPVQDTAQLAVFESVMSEAIASPHSTSFRRAYEAERCGDYDLKWALLEQAGCHYHSVRVELPQSSHEGIMQRLLERGTQLIADSVKLNAEFAI